LPPIRFFSPAGTEVFFLFLLNTPPPIFPARTPHNFQLILFYRNKNLPSTPPMNLLLPLACHRTRFPQTPCPTKPSPFLPGLITASHATRWYLFSPFPRILSNKNLKTLDIHYQYQRELPLPPLVLFEPPRQLIFPNASNSFPFPKSSPPHK